MYFLDANLFVRFLTNDDAAKGEACKRLFLQIEAGEMEAFTSETIVAEVFYVLTSSHLYHLPAEEACARMRPVLTMERLHPPSRRACLAALDSYARYPFFRFEDALSTAYMPLEELDGIYSYDRDFDRVPGIRRVEP